jgi:hypothetical protein
VFVSSSMAFALRREKTQIDHQLSIDQEQILINQSDDPMKFNDRKRYFCSIYLPDREFINE